MKNYILFSTNNSKAVDNVSLCIETEIDSMKAIDMIHDACKYSSISITPIGEPMSGCLELDVAIEEIKKIVLHKRVRVVDKKQIDIAISTTGIPGVSIFNEDNKVCLEIKTSYESGNPDLVVKEHDKLETIIALFGCKHVAYHRQRCIFELVPSDTEDVGIDWAIVKGDVVQITKKYSYITTEI